MEWLIDKIAKIMRLKKIRGTDALAHIMLPYLNGQLSITSVSVMWVKLKPGLEHWGFAKLVRWNPYSVHYWFGRIRWEWMEGYGPQD